MNDIYRVYKMDFRHGKKLRTSLVLHWILLQIALINLTIQSHESSHGCVQRPLYYIHGLALDS